MNTTKVWLNVPSGGDFDWLVISDLTALCDIISVYIEAFLREREKGKRYYRAIGWLVALGLTAL